MKLDHNRLGVNEKCRSIEIDYRKLKKFFCKCEKSELVIEGKCEIQRGAFSSEWRCKVC